MASLIRFLKEEIFLPRLKKAEVLVVYDVAQRYRKLCLDLADDSRIIVDASVSSIEARELAADALRKLAEPQTRVRGVLIYVPAKAPVTDEEKQVDPFSVYAACGGFFPDGDGDEYLSLCLKARVDHATEIRRIFAENPNPSFDVIDAVGGGAGWPNLQALLKVESARDILLALLAPTETQKTRLKGEEAWVSEAKALLQTALGMKLISRAKTWGPIADELWRFLLYSEFVFDLPAALPEALVNVPRAQDEAISLVEDLCDQLRNDRRTQPLYIERAEYFERELNLPVLCSAIEELGVRDTFPFEERSFFAQAVKALKADDVDTLRAVLGRHQHSVWVGRGENQVQWTLLQSAVNLVEACDDADRQLVDNSKSQESLIDYYTSRLREVDRLQREFEQAVSDHIHPDVAALADVTLQARKTYRRLTDKVQELFIRHLESSGWPPAGRLSNADAFDKLVAPKLRESGKRVALLLIDSLRYELGVELEKQLADDSHVEVSPAFAQLPSVTPVGMASLLPGAGSELRLLRKDGEMVVALGDSVLTNVTQRMDVLKSRYGQRFAEAPLTKFVQGVCAPPAETELYVLRSNTIDSHMESTPDMALRIIHDSLKAIRVAIHKLQALGFHEAFILTDHGFYLNTAIEPGDTCGKPQGNWISLHDRLLLGDGTSNAANFVIPAASLGIRGDFNQVAGPRAMVSYTAGGKYFHGGASLQECVVPAISVRMQAPEPKHGAAPTVALTYKRGAKVVTTRLPVFEIALGEGDLFTSAPIEVLLEAHDKNGNVVGEAKPGGPVNPATHTISISPGTSVQITLKMDMAFEGKFSVLALDPNTFAVFSKLELKTDYTV